MALICDTGVLYAAYDRRDAAHEACSSLLTGTDDVVTIPAPVVVELEWLLTARKGLEPFAELLDNVDAGAVEIAALSLRDYARVRELCVGYRDLPLGFVDASVVAVAERLDERRIATLDQRHFTAVRPRHAAAFTLLP